MSKTPLKFVIMEKMDIFDFTWIIAIISITGTFFNIKKKVLCFYLWAVVEVLCFMLDIQNKQYGRAFLDMFGFSMNIYGIITWTREDKEKNNMVIEGKNE
ncbi:MAG: nicotinamide mononucleotide transporter family protein [Endomicrobium sp.]|nr:nicotinamide mononucleotide transporter family protein [Endomicrobium sp.]